jgi:DNA-binding IclR family transcriptional regulator
LLPDGEFERYLMQYGLPKNEEWEGVKNEKSFREQIRRIRENGYAIQVTKEKIVGLAVPVFKSDKAIAGISVYMPQFRYSKSDKTGIINLMNQASKRITQRLK